MANYTNFYVDYALDNDDAQDDATISATGAGNLSNLSSLPEGLEINNAFSKEHNFVVLDGSYDEIDGLFGFISANKSDSTGHFATNPMITATFSSQHTSYVLSLKFVEDAPTQIEVKWYLGTAVMYGMIKEINPNDTVCEIQYPIEAYDKITIEFLEALPDRYIKLERIEFGTTMHWDETIVKSATMVKGCDRLSNMLSVDTLTFELVDTSNSMNFGNPKGLHTLLKRNQAMYPYEVLDGQILPLGKFYLNTFTTEGNVGKVQATSFLGVMDKIHYKGSQSTSSISYLIEDIFLTAGLTSDDYEIDEETLHQFVYGVIKPMSCREALREVLFACHSVIDTSNPNKIKIYKYSDTVITGLDRSNKIFTKVCGTEPVTGVRLNYSTYRQSEELTTLVNDVYNKGVYTVIFDKLYYYGTYVEPNYRVINNSASCVTFEVLADAVTVTIRGYETIETQKSVVIKREPADGELEKIEEYNTTLCNDTSARALAQTIYEYHNSTNLSLQVQHYATEISMDYSRYVENPVQDLDGFVSMFTQRTFNLTGGFVDTAQMIGKFNVADRYYFTGREDTNSTIELYAGEGTEII